MKKVEKRGKINRKMWERYKNQITVGVTVILIILSMIGSYQYYKGIVEEGRLWSTVFFSTIKLYTFSPTASVTDPTPICYEVAKWLAPVCTAYWIFRVLEILFHHSIGMLKRKFTRRRQIAVFGYNEESEIFIRNLIRDNEEGNLENRDKYMVMLVTERPLERETRLELERRHVLVYQMNLLDEENSWMEERFMGQCLKTLREMVLFYEDATLNFSILRNFMNYVEKNEGIKNGTICCAVRCEDKILKKIIMEYYEHIGGIKPFELSIFNLPEIAAAELFLNEPLYKNCLAWTEKQLENKNLPSDEILKSVPNPHLLIAGFGRYGQAVFEKALLMGMLSNRSEIEGYQKLRITILDRDKERCQDIIESRYPRIKEICDLEYLSADMESLRVERQLAKLPAVTYMAICFSDQTMGVSAMEKMKRYLSIAELYEGGRACLCHEVPVAVRMKVDDSVIRYWNQQTGLQIHSHTGINGNINCKIRVFGTDRKILTHENIIRYHLEDEAKKFHASYYEMQKIIFGISGEKSRDELWGELDFEKKESCRAQVLNKNYFYALIQMLSPFSGKNRMLGDAEDTELFLKKLSQERTLDLLASLEHKRWCNFCYSFGYVGNCKDKAEKGKEHRITLDGEEYYGKVHYCLLEDWDKMKEEENTRKTILYDVCSIYAYADNSIL